MQKGNAGPLHSLFEKLIFALPVNAGQLPYHDAFNPFGRLPANHAVNIHIALPVVSDQNEWLVRKKIHKKPYAAVFVRLVGRAG